MRGINIAESLCRVDEIKGHKVHRVTAFENYSYFHGILVAFLESKLEDTKLETDYRVDHVLISIGKNRFLYFRRIFDK